MSFARPGSVLAWLLDDEFCPSIEGRDKVYASSSERKRQLQNRAWTITGFVGGEPVKTLRPAPDDPMPDEIAEVTMCKGSEHSQRSIWYEPAIVERLLAVWPEPLKVAQRKADAASREVMRAAAAAWERTMGRVA